MITIFILFLFFCVLLFFLFCSGEESSFRSFLKSHKTIYFNSAVIVNNGLNYRMFQIERFFLEKNKIPNIHSFRKLYLVYDNISRCHTLHFTNITIPKLTECAIFYLFSKNLAIWNKPLQYEYSIKIL